MVSGFSITSSIAGDMHRTRLRFFWWILAAAVTLFAGAAAVLSVEGLRDKVVDTDLAVIPGNTVFPDGTLSARLKSRLDAALPLYREGHVKGILVSGGIGAEGQDEAAAMQRYLVGMGVPAAAIITDNKGINTFETARFTAALMKEKGYRPPILVSQFFHIARFELALKRHGVATGGHVHARYFETRDLYSQAREVVGYAGYAFKGD
jgi:vancomycin permeability regulator SanA